MKESRSVVTWCIHFPLLHDNYNKLTDLKQHIYYLTVPTGQQLAGLSAQAEIRAANSSEALGPLSNSLVVGRIQFLAAVGLRP